MLKPIYLNARVFHSCRMIKVQYITFDDRNECHFVMSFFRQRERESERVRVISGKSTRPIYGAPA